jgi:hypothetical protein
MLRVLYFPFVHQPVDERERKWLAHTRQSLSPESSTHFSPPARVGPFPSYNNNYYKRGTQKSISLCIFSLNLTPPPPPPRDNHREKKLKFFFRESFVLSMEWAGMGVGGRTSPTNPETSFLRERGIVGLGVDMRTNGRRPGRESGERRKDG